MKTFTNVDDEVLIDTILAARERIVFVSPGLSKRVAVMLSSKIREMSDKQVVIVLDVDPEVCRMGYGDIEGLEIVQQAAAEGGITLDHQPGVRIGVLMTDQQTLIYAPTPQLIEAGSKTPAHPNAIRLNTQEVPSLDAACGGKGDQHRDVGLDPVQGSAVQAVKKDLAENPPKKFNVSRSERIFNSAMEYIEFHFTNFRLSQKEVPIPAELMGLADDADLRARWKNGFRLFGDKKSFEVKIKIKDSNGQEREEIYTEHRLGQEKAQILNDFVITVPNHGAFILRNQKQRFVDAINCFSALVQNFKEAVDSQIEEELKTSKVRLIEYLAPMVSKAPPSSWRKTMLSDTLSLEEAERRLDSCLSPLFSAVDQVFNPEVKVSYKGITYETINDSLFRSAARTALRKIGAEDTFDTLFREYDAAPETGKRTRT